MSHWEKPEILIPEDPQCHVKGAPESEYRTYTRLVSPAFGRKKKKRNPLILDKIRHLELTYTLYKYQKNYNSLIDN